MQNYWAFIALDVAGERTREADRHRLAALAHGASGSSPSVLRRFVARGVAAVSRSFASLARRLDECAADELADALYADRLATSH
ncbi:MAG TPA: hypothetical protein VK871_09240 [Candidatus Limnocylindrales bacterium]|nr:hypothetical protein [Candidatus Limnocylindrales bacterium]